MWILFFLCFLLCAAPASAADEDSIVLLMRGHSHRDADLRRIALDPEQLEALQTTAGVRLVAGPIQRDGSHLIHLPESADDGPTRETILTRLRAHPDVLYVDRPPPSIYDPTTEGSQTLDRLVILFRSPRLRDLSDRHEDFPVQDKKSLIRRAGVPLYIERPMSGGAWVIRLFQRMPVASVQAIAERIGADDSVSWVVPAVRGRFQNDPDDPLYADQWPLHDPVAGIQAPQAWEITTGSSDITVAVLDSGLRAQHPDLKSRVLPGYDFVSDVWRSGDYDGRDSDAADPGDAARNAECAPGAPPSPSSWHGTHVAGTIGAAADNQLGITGVDWSARLLPIRIGGKCGIDPIDLADGIRWAAGTVPSHESLPANPYPADIINLSIGFAGACPPYVQDAISDALAAGALVVAAAGNHATSAEQYYPANCSGVLSVYATNRRGARSAYSNYGRVHLAAPGGSAGGAPENAILSTINEGVTRPMKDHYGYKLGTSMAAPHVSGVAALILAASPDLEPGELFNVLTLSARDFPADTVATCTNFGPRSCGAGILDAGRAVRSIAPGSTSRSRRFR